MHANTLHGLMFTQETVKTRQMFVFGDKKKLQHFCATVFGASIKNKPPRRTVPPRSDPNTSNDVFFSSYRNYKDEENKILDATHLYLKTAAVQNLHNFNLVPN